MKKYILFLLILFVFSTVMVVAQKESKDIPAIKLVIEKETKAFFEIDYETWQAQWVHTPYAFWSFSDTTDVNYFSGWDEINKGFEKYFKTSKPTTANIERTWQSIEVFGNTAFARFTQKISEEDITRAPQAEVRFLIKEKGIWKIANVTVIRKSMRAR